MLGGTKESKREPSYRYAPDRIDAPRTYFLGPVSQGYFDFRVDRRLRPPRLIGSVENQDKNKADDELVWSALVLYLLECQVANISLYRYVRSPRTV